MIKSAIVKTGIVNSIILTGWAFLALAGCTRMDDELSGEKDRIQFGASTSWQNEKETRTEYSGEFNTLSDGRYERIDWVSGTDRIRIFSPQAYGGGANTAGTASDYTITAPVSPTTPVPSGSETEKSTAYITSVTENSLRWGSSNTHYFYGLYPAPGTKWKYDNSVEVGTNDVSITGGSNNEAVITGTVPATQVVKWNASQKEYEPNMNYAYMYAATSVSTRSSVTLSFKPLVTTLRFTILAKDANAEGLTLSGFKLISSTKNLSGPFTATVSPSTCSVAAGTGTFTKEVAVDIADDDRQHLSQGSAITVTLFTLAVETITDLSIELNFTSGAKRTLALKDGSSNITVDPRCKTYINSLSVPGTVWTYTFGSLSNLTVGYTGGSGNIASGFTSYRTNGVTTQPVGFSLEYSTNGGSSWSSTPPSWLSTGGVNTAGGTSGQTFTAKVQAQANSNSDPHHTTLANSSRARGTSSSPFDLSTYNPATTKWENNQSSTISRTTANCYVVQGSGYYKFPLVYGNGVKGGTAWEPAYRAKAGVSGSWRTDAGETYTNFSWGARRYLGSFKDHLDNIIYDNGNSTSSPYLTTHLNKAASAFTAVLLWQDVPGLVTDVSISGSGTGTYLTFSVPSATITQGNALVAVKVDNKIAWSWHIWVTDQDLTATVAGSNSSAVKFAPVNLGWCDGKSNESYPARSCQVKFKQATTGTERIITVSQTAGSVTNSGKGNCPYYQWGRKDPLQASSGATTSGENVGANKTYYYASGYAFSASGTTDNRATIGNAIQNPCTHFSNSSNCATLDQHWCSTAYINFWSSTLNETGRDGTVNTNAKTKTIYDPCPVGFRVPSMDVWENLSNATFPWNSTLLGMVYSSTGLFLPAAGQRITYNGAINYVGNNGFYWSANPCGTSPENDGNHNINLGYMLYFYNNDYWRTDRNAANGLSIRPVEDK